MSSPESCLPAPRYKDVPFVPAVDPDDLKCVWNVKPPWTANSHKDASSRARMSEPPCIVVTCSIRWFSAKLLDLWTHDDQLDDAVFRLAASFPLHERQGPLSYMIPGDELYPFDPNTFLQRLVEETGIAHTWQPLPTKSEEGGRCFVTFSAHVPSAAPDPDRAARHRTRALLWEIWGRFSGINEIVAPEEARAQFSRVWFEDFLIANTDLVQRVLEAHRQKPCAVGLDLMKEIEQRASKRS